MHEDNGSEGYIDDINLESEEELGNIGAAQAKMKKLREQLKEAQQKRDEYLDGWQRCKADSINARKEAAMHADRSHARGKENVFEDLIPALDSFDMAIESETWNSVDASWRGGIEQVRNQLLDVLSRHGIERYGKIGDVFDHALHDAIQEADDMPGESNSIVKILRYGYRSKDRVIRPAQVIVKK